jgi:hypothetical protein
VPLQSYKGFFRCQRDTFLFYSSFLFILDRGGLSLILFLANDLFKSNSWQGVDEVQQNSGRVIAEQITVVEE